MYLKTHWGARYWFAVPQAPGGRWTARAKFGVRDEIQEFSATELLEEVRAHYQAHHVHSSLSDEPLREQPGAPS